DATLTRLIRPTGPRLFLWVCPFVGRIRVYAASGYRCTTPDATLTRLIRPTSSHIFLCLCPYAGCIRRLAPGLRNLRFPIFTPLLTGTIYR
ncbi:hypothetical protein HMPREF1608_05387, partial [Escherichia coli 908525]